MSGTQTLLLAVAAAVFVVMGGLGLRYRAMTQADVDATAEGKGVYAKNVGTYRIVGTGLLVSAVGLSAGLVAMAVWGAAE